MHHKACDSQRSCTARLKKARGKELQRPCTASLAKAKGNALKSWRKPEAMSSNNGEGHRPYITWLTKARCHAQQS
ncbi:hypothetical protein XELAEV_18028089mg [Xenopus laevis]|uniref:Uncharacterized protein n=1 Tax=Xenopus laevis TaxID=8355 RepID=A0A974HK83_XENLA|nr:hypothetical protein XELAEV_18028089mg [Xenopus laevis]